MSSLKSMVFVSLLASASYAAPWRNNTANPRLPAGFAGFEIPDGHPDGVYHASIDGDGNIVHELVTEIIEPARHWLEFASPYDISQSTNASANATNLLRARGGGVAGLKDGTTCAANGAVMDPTDVAKAAYNLGNACDCNVDFVPARGSRYALYGSSVVFVCNYLYQGPQHCLAKEVNHDISSLQSACADVTGQYSPVKSF